MTGVRTVVRRMLSAVAYAAAGVVILLAILLGMFRLFLPRLPEYQEDIKGWANAAIGLDVEFTDMNARWRLTGPELNFFGAELSLPDTTEPFIRAGEVTVGVGLLRLLIDRTLVVDRLLVSDTTLSFERTDENQVLVQGLPTDELAAYLPQSSASGDVVFVGEDIEVHYRDPSAEATLGFDVALVEATRRDQRLAVEASLDLDEGFGSRLDVALDQRPDAEGDAEAWDLFIEGRSLGLARWATLLPAGVAPVTAGTSDLSLWLQWADGGVAKATANLLVEGMTVAESERGAPIEIEGRIEYSRFGDGMLVSADHFRLRTVDGDWPRSSVQLRLDRTDENELEAVEAQASYLRVTDLGYFSAWLPAQAREMLTRYRPTGAVREVKVDLAELHTDAVSFDVSGLFEDAGIGAVDALPGVRNFTGSVRANDSGGRIDSISQNLRLQIPRYVSETIGFDDASGTLIWRRSGDSLTILSDRLELSNADVTSQSSVQITIAGEGESPIVDFESTWRVADIAAAKRFLPQPVISPPLYRWLNSALVSGRLVDGRTRLQGPLDKFPFDGGEGEFRIAATLEDAVMRYAGSWPVARIRTMDVVLDGMRLYTERNSAVSAGNATEDARVEIADLRDPVLTIDAFSTGSLETIRQFVLRSPIVTLFGDQLERTSVSGDASFNLLLSYPIKAREDYDFSTRIQVSGGTLALDGFAPPISELYGIVSISREQLTSESLFGRFLDEPVTLALSRDVTAAGGYNVVADVAGQTSALGLISGLNAPLKDVVAGRGNYTARVRFPQAGAVDSLPLRIDVRSDLEGFALNLPAPLAKPADDPLPLELTIEFPESGVITSTAAMGDAVGWIGEFRRAEERWDFDRGTLAFGGEAAEQATLRGLHILGHVEELRVDDWLSRTAGEAGSGIRVGDRIRAIDLTVDDLHAYGQHYRDHRLTVDRGGNRWFVRADGDKLSGDITIPYDFSGQEPITVDMQTMVLPGPATDASPALPSASDDLDPRRLPPVSVKVAEFGIGERRLGAVDAEFVRVPEGLRADSVTASDESFEITGSAGWVVDDTAGGVPHSYVKAKLESTNVEQTMDRLSYDAGIEAGDMQLDVDVRWSGAPRRDFLNDLEGSLAVRLGSGQLNEIEPGAGRVFGLMSVVALPRRLSLDFRDVFDKGFGFDEIRGTFDIVRGEASTCDLSLSGPAAEIVIIGSADLANSEYNQTALVSANVGNTLPLVGAVVAGPQVGAALLIFSQIFKKPLQEVGQAYYGIDGTFEDPAVEVVDGTRFESASRLAGCLPASAANN